MWSTAFHILRSSTFKGKPKVIHLQPLVDKIKAKLSALNGSLLTVIGKVQLVKSIIQGMLLYSFHIYALAYLFVEVFGELD